jgi:two-component system, OmpR family, sensor kinase
MSIRRRLLALLLLLTAGGLLTAGTVSAKLLRNSLVKQKDEQLALLVDGSRRGGGLRPQTVPHVEPDGTIDPGSPSNTDPNRPSIPSDRGQPSVGPVGIVVDMLAADGTSLGGGYSRSQLDIGGGPKFDTSKVAELANRPFTAPAKDGDTQYRVLIRQSAALPVYRLYALELADVEQTVGRFVRAALIVGLSVLALLGALVWWFVRLGLRPLDRMTATAAAIAGGDLSARVDTSHPSTEVGRLGTSLNTMLGQIEASFAERTRTENRLRRFVGDASHELRTPLTSIRGYSELIRTGAISDAEGQATALARIEAEAKRMGVLVEDLLLLARADQGRTFEAKPVDLAAIVHNAVADARAAEPTREWTVTGSSSAMVNGDQDRLVQVMTNILANARTHTPAASPVEVDIARGDEAVVTVRDHGAGIPDDEVDRIFERFARLDDGRARSNGGTGLGLAIVQTIVSAHDGSVTARNHPDGGALFEVRLPTLPSGR